MAKADVAGKTSGGRVAPPAPAGKYKCPKCSNTIEVCVKMSVAPRCIKHAVGPVEMEIIK